MRGVRVVDPQVVQDGVRHPDHPAGRGAGAAVIEDLHGQGVAARLGVGVRGQQVEPAVADRHDVAGGAGNRRGAAVAPGDGRREVGDQGAEVAVVEGGQPEGSGAFALGRLQGGYRQARQRRVRR